MKMRMLVFVCFAIMLTGCQTPGDKELTVAQRQEVADVIKQKHQDMLSLTKSEDFEKSMNLWLEDGDPSWAGDPGILVFMTSIIPTKASVETYFRPMTKTRTSTNFKMEKEHIAVLSLTHAVHVYKGTFSVTDNDGNTGKDYPITTTTVWTLKNGEWKMLHVHQSWKTE